MWQTCAWQCLRMTAAIFLCVALVLAGSGGMSEEPSSLPEQPEESMLTPQRWQTLQTQMPELKSFQPILDQRLLIQQLLSWVKPNQTIVLYDATCRPISNVGQHEGRLQGDVLQSRQIVGDLKREHWDSVVLGYDIDILCGTSYEYKRTSKGDWKEVGVGATGCLETGPKNLYKVTSNAAWYGIPHYIFKKVLREEHERLDVCRDDRQRTCSWKKFGLSPEIVTPGYGMAGSSPVKIKGTDTNADCSAACPDSNEKEIDTALVLLNKAEFMQPGQAQSNHPTIFRTLRACREYNKKHRIEDPWSAHQAGE